MKTPHPHAEMIREWALDPSRKVEFRSPSIVSWIEIEEPTWRVECEYRFKPEPKPNYKIYTKVLNGFLQLEFDGETHEMKDAKVLK